MKAKLKKGLIKFNHNSFWNSKIDFGFLIKINLSLAIKINRKGRKGNRKERKEYTKIGSLRPLRILNLATLAVKNFYMVRHFLNHLSNHPMND